MQSAAEQAPTHQGAPAGGLTRHPGSLRPTEIPEGPEEYAQVYPEGYRYSQFCVLYRQWARRLRPSMRQVHRAGEKTFIDFLR